MAIIVLSSVFIVMMQVATLNYYIFNHYWGWRSFPSKVAATVVSVYILSLLLKCLPFIIVVFICSLVMAIKVWHWSLWIAIFVFIWPVIVIFFYCVLTKSLKYDTSD